MIICWAMRSRAGRRNRNVRGCENKEQRDADSSGHVGPKPGLGMSPSKWIAGVDAIGIVVKTGRYDGTYAHTDIAMSFAIWISPEFLKIFRDIESGKDNVSFVLVFKLSHFGRNAADVLTSLQRMQDYGVNLICVEDGIVIEGNILVVEAMQTAGLKMDSLNNDKIPETITFES